MVDNDAVGAFIPGPRAELPPAGEGLLSGLRFAIKDLIDVAGTRTTCGNPDWARTHPPAAGTAPLVRSLLDAGARLVGKTRTVELAFGLSGENVWHGTPRNPAAPDRFPGGSSCGSAAAVAAALADTALGTDTGGSVRIPASYCGLFGMRPSHGALSLAGVVPLAPSLDTVGWFARDAEMLERVGAALLPGASAPAEGPLLRVREAWINAMPAVAEALHTALERLEGIFGTALDLTVAPEGLPALYEHFRAIQGEEAWVSQGAWIEAVKPAFGPGVGERFAAGRAVDAATAAAARAFRQAFEARLRPLLAGGAVLVYPTSPCPAPLLSATMEEQTLVRESSLRVTAIAGLAGLPEVTLPVGHAAGGPVGLSLVGARGSDRALLALARRAAAALAL